MAARPASATAARCRSRSPRPVQRQRSGRRARCSSGNRNFEGRIHPHGARQLPGLAAAGGRLRAGGHDGYRSDQRAARQRIATASRFSCATSGRRPAEIAEAIGSSIDPAMFRKEYAEVFNGDEHWRGLKVPEGDLFAWEKDSTYVKAAAVLRRTERRRRRPSRDIEDARVLAMLGDSVTTDHISPAGSIAKDSPAGKYLIAHGVPAARFQLLRRAPRQSRSDGARHLRQHPAAQRAGAGREGGFTAHLPDGERITIFDASDALPRPKAAADRDRRQGVRLRQLARLGGQGHAAARACGR